MAMNVLIFNWRDLKNPKAGGAEEYLFNIFSRIAKDDFKITYFVAWFKGSKKEELSNNYRIVRKGGVITVYFYAFLFYMKNRKNYDLIIDSINTIPFFTPLYCRKKKIAIIYHLGGWKSYREELPVYLAIIAYLIEKLNMIIYRNVTIITVSESTKSDLIQNNIPENHIKIVWPGMLSVTPKDYNTIKKADVPTVIYIGRLKSYKRIDHVLKAFKIVKDKIKDAQLFIGGKGENEYYDYLKDIVKTEDIKDVQFLGPLTNEDKIKYLELGWVYVYPSIKEGWGLSVIEANACGTPVVGYNVSGLRDSIIDQKTGFLVPDNNVNELASKIILLLTNQKLREKIAKNAIEWSKNFSYEKSAQKFYEIIKDDNR
ncbi:MAG: glycosyltransferase family 4 protein [Thermoplasmata archaeon]